MTILTIAITTAAVRLGGGHHPAAFGRKRMTVFSFDQQPMGRNAAHVELALKRIAAKRTYASKPPRVDMNQAMTVVLLIDQMNQLPGRTAIEIANRIHMQITVFPFVLDLKIYAHMDFLQLMNQTQAGDFQFISVPFSLSSSPKIT